MRYLVNTEEEVLCDYTVSAEMKQIWIKQLEMLAKLDEVCEKYHLKYYASGGTLLGAVRHRGYIPWDDDIDVHMLTADYEKLAEVAPKEMQPYFWQDDRTQPGFSPWHAKIRNDNTTGCTKWEKENWPNGFHRGIFIDVFPLDYVPENALKFRFQRLMINRTRNAIWKMELARKEQLTTEQGRKGFDGTAFNARYQKLCTRYKRLCSMQSKPTSRIAALTFDCNEPRFVWNTAYYADTVDLEFMGATIKAPIRWDDCLKQQFGDYHVLVKGGSMHSDILFDTEVSYRVRIEGEPAAEAQEQKEPLPV